MEEQPTTSACANSLKKYEKTSLKKRLEKHKRSLMDIVTFIYGACVLFSPTTFINILFVPIIVSSMLVSFYIFRILTISQEEEQEDEQE